MARLPPFRQRRSALLDAQGVAGLYERQSSELLRFFLRRLPDPELAADLMAETFAEVLRSRHKFRGETNAELEAWVFAIAKVKFLGYLRRGRIEKRALRRLGLEAPQLASEDQDRIEALADLDQTRAVLASALSDLSDEQRAALHLRVIDELPYAEVAVRLGVTEQTARARVSRGLRALAAVLDGQLSPEGSRS
jgi:RNA polymerase sigma factor (sigma-70 family)